MVQIWPPVVDPSTLTWRITGSASVRSLPSIGRGLALYSGLISQMTLDQVKGDDSIVKPRPRILQKPDPDKSLKNFVGDAVEEYLTDGNTLSLITARDARGMPAALKWYPVTAWGIMPDDPDGYYLYGKRVAAIDVVHAQRGSDPSNPRRGVGLVEQHFRSLERAGLQEEYERQTLTTGGVPSVAVIAPQKELTEAELKEAGEDWNDKFGGPVRRPGIFPNGTKLETLSWSPSDQQAVLARQATLTDVANILNLDAYWLGAPASSHTYRSPGIMFIVMLRVSLEPVLAELEGVWGERLLPYGSAARFDRLKLTRDDMASMISMFVQAIREGLVTVDEARAYMGLAPFGTPESTTPRIPAAEADPIGEIPPAISIVGGTDTEKEREPA